VKLEVFQSLWAMELRRPDGVEHSPEEAFEMVAAAGYDGMCIDLAFIDVEAARTYQRLYERHRLGCLLNAFPNSIEALRPVLRLAREFDARFVNVIGRVMPITVAGMIPVIRAWLEMAEKEGVPILFETHRNAITNDLFSTLELLDAIPEMRLCADLSHCLVDREFWYPVAPENHALIRRVLERSWAFQGRVASREQVQVQISFPQHQKWFDVFLNWWEEGLRSWRSRAQPDAVVNFLCELGPPEYAITGPDGYELSDRWAEALIIRRRVQEIWQYLMAVPPIFAELAKAGLPALKGLSPSSAFGLPQLPAGPAGERFRSVAASGLERRQPPDALPAKGPWRFRGTCRSFEPFRGTPEHD
jgi:hypothetical protein